MSHGITSTDGLMLVHEPAWHGLGTVLSDLATAEEALSVAKLDWTVSKRPVLFREDMEDDTSLRVKYFNKFFATVRDDINQGLGVVGSKYEVLQNRDAFRFFDQVTQDPNGPKYTTAGSLHGGQKIWILAKLPSFIEVLDGDVIEEYILMTNTHDGWSRAEMYWTPVRVVCQNTMNFAQKQNKGKSAFRFRHLGSIMDHVDRAQDILKIARSNHESMVDVMKALISITPTEEEIDMVLNNLFRTETGKETAQNSNIKANVKKLTVTGAGQDIPGVAGTGYALYNGITEYCDHYQPTRPRNTGILDARLESIWFGQGRDRKSQALTEILALK